jgi:hypothetical protein
MQLVKKALVLDRAARDEIPNLKYEPNLNNSQDPS